MIRFKKKERVNTRKLVKIMLDKLLMPADEDTEIQQSGKSFIYYTDLLYIIMRWEDPL